MPIGSAVEYGHRVSLHADSPMYQANPLGLARTAMVQVFNMCFFAGKVAQIAVFAASGVLGAGLVASTAPLAAVAVLVLLGGIAVRERIPTQAYRTFVRGVLLVLAFMLAAQYLLQA